MTGTSPLGRQEGRTEIRYMGEGSGEGPAPGGPAHHRNDFGFQLEGNGAAQDEF